MDVDHDTPSSNSLPESVISRKNDYSEYVGNVTFGSELVTKTNNKNALDELIIENYYHKYIITECYNRDMALALKKSDTQRIEAETKLIQMSDAHDVKTAAMDKIINEQILEINRLTKLQKSAEEVSKIVKEDKAKLDTLINLQSKAESDIASLKETLEKQAVEITHWKNLCASKANEVNELRELCNTQAKAAEQQKVELEKLIAKERKAYLDKAEEAQRDIEGVSGYVKNLKLKIAALTDEKEALIKEHQNFFANIEKNLELVTTERDLYMKKTKEMKQEHSKKQQEVETERSVQTFNIIESLKKTISSLTKEKEALKQDVTFLTECCDNALKDVAKTEEKFKRAQNDRVCAEAKFFEMESMYNKVLADTYHVTKIGDFNDRQIKARHASPIRTQPTQVRTFFEHAFSSNSAISKPDSYVYTYRYSYGFKSCR